MKIHKLSPLLLTLFSILAFSQCKKKNQVDETLIEAITEGEITLKFKNQIDDVDLKLSNNNNKI